MHIVRIAIPSLVAILVALPAGAQSLASRVTAQDGEVLFHFAARPGVCGDGDQMIRLGESMQMGRWSSDANRAECLPGPVQLRLTVESARVTRVEMWAGPLRQRAGRDLGAVPAAESARYLLQLAGGARSERRDRVGDEAIGAAVLADSVTVWPQLLALARASTGERQGRGAGGSASFWLSRLAAAKLAGHPDDLSAGERRGERSADEEVKSQAIFVLSLRPHGEGIPPLLEIARTNADPVLRSRALFWLGQSGDARALDLFEAVLGK